MEIIKISRKIPEIKKVQEIVEALRAGRIVVLPTDTSYGLCANAFDSQIIEKIFMIKQRSRRKPISVIMNNLEMIKKITWVQQREERILRQYLPGPFTFILNRKEIMPRLLNLAGDSLGVRIPQSNIIQSITQGIDFPITATSANISGEGSIYSVKKIIERLGEQKVRPDLVVDVGRLPRIKPSTIVDLTCDP